MHAGSIWTLKCQIACAFAGTEEEGADSTSPRELSTTDDDKGNTASDSSHIGRPQPQHSCRHSYPAAQLGLQQVPSAYQQHGRVSRQQWHSQPNTCQPSALPSSAACHHVAFSPVAWYQPRPSQPMTLACSSCRCGRHGTAAAGRLGSESVHRCHCSPAEQSVAQDRLLAGSVRCESGWQPGAGGQHLAGHCSRLCRQRAGLGPACTACPGVWKRQLLICDSVTCKAGHASLRELDQYRPAWSWHTCLCVSIACYMRFSMYMCRPGSPASSVHSSVWCMRTA